MDRPATPVPEQAREPLDPGLLRRLSVAVEQGPLIVCITDASGRIEYVNPRFTVVTGYTLAAARGRTCRFLKSGETPAHEYTRLWQTVTSGSIWRGEFHNRRVDGSLYWEQASIWPLRDGSGRITHFVKTSEDITERKREQLALLESEAARATAEAERERLQAQLLHAQKMEAVGRLAGGVAHDFNNMLGVILGHSELALDQIDPASPVGRDLQAIRHAAQRSADLTRQLLGFARRQTAQPKVLDLNDVVANTRKMLARLIGEDIDLRWEPGSGLWPVRIDPTQIDQVLANLAVNARDAIAGHGTVTIATTNVTVDQVMAAEDAGFVPGDYVRLTVQDSGSGMAPEVLAHLFEPFFTTKEVGKGTGLGLATVYGILRQNGGFVDVRSAPGQGSTFLTYLPRYRPAALDVSPETPATAATGGGTESVLVVEDEPAILDMTKTMLERQGYTVMTARTAAEAVACLADASVRVDLLISDVVMPDMNGTDLADRIRQRWPGLKCLYMSGYAADVIATRGVGADDLRFVQKPFTMQSLAAKVREALDG